MTDDRWKRLLSLLRQREPIAQGEMWSEYYDYVFGYLLKLARWANSERGAPVPDPELRDLVDELTAEAFATAFDRIEEYDPAKGALPTWIIWKGRAAMNGIVGSAIDQGARDKGYIHLDDELQQARTRTNWRLVRPGLRGVLRMRSSGVNRVHGSGPYSGTCQPITPGRLSRCTSVLHLSRAGSGSWPATWAGAAPRWTRCCAEPSRTSSAGWKAVRLGLTRQGSDG